MEGNESVSLFAALAHDTRLSIFRLLVQAGPTGVAAGEIGNALKVPIHLLLGELPEDECADRVSHGELLRRGRRYLRRGLQPDRQDGTKRSSA
jgi:DNA-binding transcriptional ArsR family regulator